MSYFSLFFAIVLLLLPIGSFADPQKISQVSIIIDDMGNTDQGWRVVKMPGPVVCSILPHTPLSVELAKACYAAHKEIILHAPMQAITPHDLGPGGLRVNMDEASFFATLTADVHAVPHVQGINNHMGSLLTESPRAMSWVMQVIKPYGLFYIDSRTSAQSVAEQVAKEYAIPTARRDVFLDDIQTPQALQNQFNELLILAKQRGSAIAIGHPYPVTMAFLEKALPQLNAEGFQLVPVSNLLDDRVVARVTHVTPTAKPQAQIQSPTIWQSLQTVICPDYPAMCSVLKRWMLD